MKAWMLLRGSRYLHHKRSFLTFSTAFIGTWLAIAFLWQYAEYGGIGLWFVIIGLCLLGGFVWGLIMWAIFGESLRAASKEISAKETGNTH